MSELNISKCKIKINIKKIKRRRRNIFMESLQHIKCQNKVLGNTKKTKCKYYNKIV